MAMAFKMATSGIIVSDECNLLFMEMKMKKLHSYIVLKIDEISRRIMVDKVGPAQCAHDSYENLIASLPNNDCRYIIFDYDFVTVDKCHKSKLFFIAWAPAASRVRAKVLYATSKDCLRKAFEGISYEVQATETGEMGLDIIKNKAL